MRLTDKEHQEVTAYLVAKLKRKRFKVSVNRYGEITNVAKNGISCCPAVVDSIEDGRHGFSYLCNEMNSADKHDLGYYFKLHSSDATGGMGSGVSIGKYTSEAQVRVDMHNHKDVIDRFCAELNADYAKVRKSLGESADSELFDVVNMQDAFSIKIRLLADYLQVPPFVIEPPMDEYDPMMDYVITDESDTHAGEQYKVCTDEEAHELVRDVVMSDLAAGDVSDNILNQAAVKSVLIESEVRRHLRELFQEEADEMCNSELAEWLLDEGLLSLDDPREFRLKGEPGEDEDYGPNDIDGYELLLSNDELCDIYIEARIGDDAKDTFLTYYEGDLPKLISEYLRNRRNNGDSPPLIDIDALVEDIAYEYPLGPTLSYYDGRKLYLGYEGDDYIYAYRDN